MTCPHAYSDGAYVLGALSPAERSTYQAHLTTCQSCASAVAELAPVPGLLGRVDPAALRPGPAGPSRLQQLLAAITRQRRRQARFRRWQLAAAALAAAVLAVAGSTVWFGLSNREPVPVAAMTPVAESVRVTAQVAMEDHAVGTEIWMACQYPVPQEPGYESTARTFRLVAVGVDGSSEQVGSWRAAPGDEVSMTGMTKFVVGELVRLELHDAAGDPLLSYDVR